MQILTCKHVKFGTWMKATSTYGLGLDSLCDIEVVLMIYHLANLLHI